MGKKLLRTLKLYKAQFISMIIMVALGMGVFVGFNMEWVSIEKNTENLFQDTGFADYRIISESGFSADELEKIRAIGEVDRAARYISVNADVADRGGDSIALTVTEDGSVSGFVLIEGTQYDPASTDGIWLSDKYAAANGISVGDGLTLEYSGMSLTGKVDGLVKSGEHMICARDETQLMPDFNTYGYAYISPKMYEDALGFEFYPQINVISQMEKDEFTDKVEACLESTPLVLTKDETTSYAEAQGEAEEGKSMGAVLPVIFLVIAMLTMVTTMHRIAAKEKTQIGTLKALGFPDRRILRHYTSYAFVTGIIGCAIGVALGYFIAGYIMNPNGSMGTYLDMPEWKLYLPWFCYVVVAVV